jgi:hypothetical protein
LRLPAVNRAREELARWSVKWQPHLPDMPTHNDQVVHYANRSDNRPRIRQAFEDYAHQHAEATHPERAVIAAAAQVADTELGHALHALYDTKRRHAAQLNRYGSLGHTNDPDAHLERLERAVTTGRTELATVQQQIGRLGADPRSAHFPPASSPASLTTVRRRNLKRSQAAGRIGPEPDSRRATHVEREVREWQASRSGSVTVKCAGTPASATPPVRRRSRCSPAASMQSDS